MEPSGKGSGVSQFAEWQASEARRTYLMILQMRESIHRLAEIIDRVVEQEFPDCYIPVLPKLLARERPLHEIRRKLGLEDG